MLGLLDLLVRKSSTNTLNCFTLYQMPKKERLGRGAPGNYKLNQKAVVFNDRRTNRTRDRGAANRLAIKESFQSEKR
jgi:hypothetical protein